jgi:hypothetical protein
MLGVILHTTGEVDGRKMVSYGRIDKEERKEEKIFC